MRITHRRGFTLIELLVTLAVASLLMTIVVSCVVAFQRTMASTESQRGSTESGRDAMFEIEHALREAGFGLDPLTSFDFAWFRCSSTTTGVEGQPVCRDSVNGPDNLVFMARNSWYRIDPQNQTPPVNNCTPTTGNNAGCPTGQAWPVVSTPGNNTGSTVTLKVTQVPVTFYYGQVLEFVCAGGTAYTMGTVAAQQVVNSTGNVTLSLYPPSPAAGAIPANPYQANDFVDPNVHTPGGETTILNCFNNTAIAFTVERFGFFIQTYNNIPWLVLDTGMDLSSSGVDPIATLTPANLIPIAPYVEDMQVAYILDATGGIGTPTAPDSNQDWVTGNDPTQTQPEAPYPGATGPVPLVPAYGAPDGGNAPPATPAQSVLRVTMNPANIRGVQVLLELRSAQPDLSMPSNWFGDALPSNPYMEDESQRTMTNAQLGGYHRQVVMTTISPVNMTTADMFCY